ncbi:MAG TPA: DUF2249 domain-containing protein [Longimicrobiales bacterium]
MNLEKLRQTAARKGGQEAGPMPAAIAAMPADGIADLDVRADLRNGVEPFSRIMEAVGNVQPGGVLRVRAIFEPAPLYAVLGRRGFMHWTERLADDDWRVWFYHGDANAQAEVKAAAATGDMPAEEDLVVLDVRGLEPPEPMVQTLSALETLPPGKSLLQINARVPQFLLAELDQRGFEYVLLNELPDQVRGLIRRKADDKQLDVRVIPPREKHPAIFQTFDALPPGSAFVLINDHDPFPLRYQFEAERANAFSWTYLEKGPVVWRVRIAKVAQ